MKNKFSKKDFEPIVEMIDPTLGYVKDNVLVISRAASELVNRLDLKERIAIMQQAKAGIPIANS